MNRIANPQIYARSLISAVVALLALSAPGGLLAAEREHGAHVHGVSRLTLAVEGDRVELGLEAPGMDIVGFEHAARTTEDRATVDRAVGYLKAGDRLFALPAAAQCRLQSVEVEAPGSPDEHRHGHGKGESFEHADEGHAGFHAQYRFHCGRSASLTHIDAGNFFKRFPAAREIEAQAIAPKGQRAGELTPAASKLTF